VFQSIVFFAKLKEHEIVENLISSSFEVFKYLVDRVADGIYFHPCFPKKTVTNFE